MKKKLSSETVMLIFNTTEITGDIAKKIREEILEKPTKEALEKNKKASELLHRLRSC